MCRDSWNGVTEADSTRNVAVNDVVGNKDDSSVGGSMSLVQMTKELLQHIHSVPFEVPSNNYITLTTNATGGVEGAKVELTADTGSMWTDIHFCAVSDISANGWYTIRIYSGEAGSEELVSVFIATRSAVQSREGQGPTMSSHIPPNQRLSASVTGVLDTERTLKFGIILHPYDPTM